MGQIGIITFLHNGNYGSMLQAYALWRTVTGLGYPAVEIDYCPSPKEKLRNLLLSGNSPRLIMEGLRKRSAQGAEARQQALERFRSEHLPATQPCADLSALRRATADMEVLLCGSDQIWSPTWLNPAYFFSFAAKNQIKLAYAPSLGVRQIAEQKKKRMAALLKGFQAISVREEEGARLLEDITGQDVPVLPDPVFLLSREEWRSLAEIPETSPYLLCYMIGENPAYWQRAAELAEETGLPIRVIPMSRESAEQGYQPISNVTPQRWLGAIAGASMLLTDSFHGAAFAAILGTACHILRRDREDDPASKNSRIDQLERMLGGADTPQAQGARLDALRAQGIDWLREQLAKAAAVQEAGENEAR